MYFFLAGIPYNNIALFQYTYTSGATDTDLS